MKTEVVHLKWEKQLCKWIGHLARHPDCWVARFLCTRDDAWLEAQREMFLVHWKWTESQGWANTRMAPAKVHLRYEIGLKRFAEAKGLGHKMKCIWKKNLECDRLQSRHW